MRNIVLILLTIVMPLAVSSCNVTGQLPDDFSRTTTKGNAKEVVEVTDAAAGRGYSLAVRGGVLWSWGNNDAGQLGLGDKTTRTLPTKVLGISDVTSVSTGLNFSLALTSTGEVWSWGVNDFGQLGLGGNTAPSTGDMLKPTRIEALKDIQFIYAGVDYALAIDNEAHVWSWGRNEHGQLGLGANTPAVPDGTNQPTPQKIENFTDVVYITAGDGHVLAKRSDNTAWSWGRNDKGQLGLGANIGKQNSPQQIPAITDVESVYTGYFHSAIVTQSDAEGVLYTFGDNKHMQLGGGALDVLTMPTPTPLPLFEATDDPDRGIKYFHTSIHFSIIALKIVDEEKIKIWGAWRGMIFFTPTTYFGDDLGFSTNTIRSNAHHLLIIDEKGLLWVVGDSSASYPLGLSDATNIREARKHIPKIIAFE